MAEIARWRNHIWGAFGTEICSFTDMTMSAGCTTDSKGTEQAYNTFKASSPFTMTMTLLLMKCVGCEPMTDVQELIEEAESGADGYMYIGGELLATYKLMLTKVSVSDTKLSPSGEMISCKAALTFNQSTMSNGKLNGSTGKDKEQKKDINSLVKIDSFTNRDKLSGSETTQTGTDLRQALANMLSNIFNAKSTKQEVDAVTSAQPPSPFVIAGDKK